jgi:hypothetical protein
LNGLLPVDVGPWVALGAEASFLAVAPDVSSKTGGKHDAVLGVAQYWPSERFWLKGGFVGRSPGASTLLTAIM